MRRFGMALVGVALLVPACGMVPDDAYAQAPPGQDCSSAEHHAFDFWIGVWDVMVEKEPGKPQLAGVNRIERVMGGCALAEHWESAGGGHGTSLNFYDRRTTRWHQTWIDEGGNGLLLSGAFTNGRMVLTSEPNKAGAFDRITWSSQPDGSVRQVWEQTSDGRTWKTAFDGSYVRRKAS